MKGHWGLQRIRNIYPLSKPRNPVTEEFEKLKKRIDTLEKRLTRLEQGFAEHRIKDHQE